MNNTYFEQFLLLINNLEPKANKSNESIIIMLYVMAE